MPDVKVTISGDASQLKNTLSGLRGSFTELNSMLSVVKQGAQVLGQAFDATVGSTMKLGQSVEDMSRLIGASAEQSSRLIAVSKMLGMSTESVSAAMMAAIRKGYAPTIEGLSKISDAYLSIQDPIARSKYLMDVFGRGGAAMGELMEKGSAGIRDLGTAADATGTIMSQKDVDAAKKLSVEINTLKLNAEGLGIKIGTVLIPALSQMADLQIHAGDAAAAFGVTLGQQGAFFDQNGQMIFKNRDALDAHYAALQREVTEVGFLSNAINALHDKTVNINVVTTRSGVMGWGDIAAGTDTTSASYLAQSGRGGYLGKNIPTAIGGPLTQGVHLVGEEGPELIIGGNVIRASVTRMLSKGFGGIMGHALDVGGGIGGGGGMSGSQLLAGGNWQPYRGLPIQGPGAVVPGQPPLNPRDYGYGGGGGGSTSTVVSQAAAAAAAAATAASGPAVAQATREAQAQVTALQAKLDLSNAKNTRALEKIADILMQQGTYQDIGRAVGAANMLLDIGY